MKSQNPDLKVLLFGIVTLLSICKVDAQWTTLTNNLTPYQIRRNSSTYFSIDTTGQVWIQTPGLSQQFRLSVDGMIRAREIYVNNDLWADYVFNNDYPLLTLSELERYVKTHKHLPNIPSARDIQDNNLAVGDTQRLLLEKIEELTLYIIQQQKEIDALKNLISTK